jgi:hypothetical protein
MPKLQGLGASPRNARQTERGLNNPTDRLW